MTLRDLLEMSAGNLWRMKLRTILTMAGVVIAIGAFVSMVSFGAGTQQNVSDEYEKLGLFTTMQVHPPDADSLGDTTEIPLLNDSMVARLSQLPGVRLAYPYDAFTVTARLDSLVLNTEAQALPLDAIQTKLFSQLLAGRHPASDSAKEALVSSGFLKEHKFESPDSVVGRTIVVSVSSSTIDSALVYVARSGIDRLEVLADTFDIDSIDNLDYLRRTAMDELNASASNFFEGYLKHRKTTSDTLTIVGVIERPSSGRLRTKPILIPEATARRFTAEKGGPEPADLLAALQGGRADDLFGGGNDPLSPNTYPRVTLDLEPGANYGALSDSVRALGFEAFSYFEQFAEMQRFFLYFDLILGVVGLIALLTASLGIVNTMVMSIIERRREIGILKSLGADDRQIWFQFLVESGVIGASGAVLGILLGWTVTRIASFVAKKFMESEGVSPVELFALPWWLILIALLFGTIVSVAAGLYPAARAARVDPVDALRNE